LLFQPVGLGAARQQDRNPENKTADVPQKSMTHNLLPLASCCAFEAFHGSHYGGSTQTATLRME
jgi:hypothetical protein